MKVNNYSITRIEAEEGKLLRKINTGAIVGKKVTLGYNYYENEYTLGKPYLEKPEDYEEVDEYEGWKEKPLIDQAKRLEGITKLLEQEKQEFKNRGLSAVDMIKHQQFAPKWGEDEGFKEGDSVAKGDKFTYDGKLWAVLQDHTIMLYYYPSINTASLYVEVTPDYNEQGEEMGTLDNPIPYEGNMVLENGKYYSQDSVTYLCNRDSGNPVYHALKDLVGLYVILA